MSEEIVDVLIIGAGASGAALAWSLAETRMNILCLEQGDWMKTGGLSRHAAATGRRASSATSASAPTRAGGARTIRSTTATRRSRSRCSTPSAAARSSTPRTSRASIRRDFRVRTLDGVADDWPLDYARLEPYYDVNARMMGVSGLAGDPAYPPKEVPLPPVRARQARRDAGPRLQSPRLALVAVGQRDRDARSTRAARRASTPAPACSAARRAPRRAPTSPTGRRRCAAA